MIINKIRQIKYSRLSEKEKYFMKIFSNLEEIKLEDWQTSVFYRNNGNLIMIRKLKTNLLLIDDRIINDYKIKYNIDFKFLKEIFKNYFNWNVLVIEIETEHLFMINEELFIPSEKLF